MKYSIELQETVTGKFEIEANSIKEAKEKFIKGYFDCEFVNEPGDLIFKQIQISNKLEQSDWIDF